MLPRYFVVAVCAIAALSPVGSAARQDSAAAVEMSVEDIRKIVDRVGKGRSLQPAQWPGGARVAVLLSFDADDETDTCNEFHVRGQSVNEAVAVPVEGVDMATCRSMRGAAFAASHQLEQDESDEKDDDDTDDGCDCGVDGVGAGESRAVVGEW